MFVWSPFPFIRYSIALIAGILFYESQFSVFNNTYFTVSVFTAAFVLWVIDTFLFTNQFIRVLAGLCVLIAISVIGYQCAGLKKEINSAGHYTEFTQVEAFQGVVSSDHTERKDYFRYDFEIKAILTHDSVYQSHGRIFLYVRKEESKTIYQYGDHLSIIAKYHDVGPPGNPEEFDYRSYLQKQNIFSHAFASESDIEVLGYAPASRILAAALQVRAKCKSIIFDYLKEPREQAILTALLLGIKDHLDEDTKLAYASAGAMHVLAVSGLHVGIVYYLIKILLGFLRRRKLGKVLFILFSITLIWAYALITGFSPSVLRAAVMFSVVLVSETVSKRPNVYNSLGIAAFFLLLYDPYLIYSVGFQLSFAAVFGIVFLQPKLVRLLTPNGVVLNYLWMITCVSISAQLATFPLTVYYFHQFPTYFLVSNVIVIPAAAVFLVLGILLIIGTLVHTFIGHVIGFVLFYLLWSVNEMIGLLTYLPLPIVDWLYFDFYDTILVYSIVLIFSIALDHYRKDMFKLGLITVFIFALWINVKDAFYHQQHRIIIYEIKDHVALDLVQGKEALLLIDSLGQDQLEVVGFQVNPFRLANGLPPINATFKTFEDSELISKMDYGYLLIWKGKRIVILTDDTDLEIVSQLKADIIYLQGENYWCTENFEANQIIIGSNTQYYDLKKLKSFLNDNEKPSHSLVENGFYEIRL